MGTKLMRPTTPAGPKPGFSDGMDTLTWLELRELFYLASNERGKLRDASVGKTAGPLADQLGHIERWRVISQKLWDMSEKARIAVGDDASGW